MTKKSRTILSTAILAIISLFMIANTAQAAPTPIIPSGSNGGVGSAGSTFTPPPVNASTSVETSGPWGRINVWAENREKRTITHEHIDDQTGEIYTHTWTEEKSANANVWGQVINGELAGQSFILWDVNADVRWTGDGYRADWDIKLVLTGDETFNWTEPGRIRSSSEGGLLGPEYSFEIEVGYEKNHWHDKDDNCHDELTENLAFNVSAWFKECEAKNIQTSIEMSDLNWDGTTYDIVNFSGSVDFEYIDPNSPAIDDTIIFPVIEKPTVAAAVQTPEPATMSVLALGGLALLRRKRR